MSFGLGKLNNAPLYIDDSPGATVEQIRAKARRLKRKYEIQLVVVDYLQLMTGRGDSRVEEVSHVTRNLKLLAKEVRIPVVALSQLSRRCEERTNHRPILSDLRESGSVEQDADVVLMLYRDEPYDENTLDKGVIEINVAKQRNGPTGTVYATWLGDHYAIAYREAPYRPTPLRRSRKPSMDDVDA